VIYGCISAAMRLAGKDFPNVESWIARHSGDYPVK
jgi:hypothetical protein